jgi:hypothetical protein
MSANAEDITIFDAFFNSPQFTDRNHTYMEIGAHDGVSNVLCSPYSMVLILFTHNTSEHVVSAFR